MKIAHRLGSLVFAGGLVLAFASGCSSCGAPSEPASAAPAAELRTDPEPAHASGTVVDPAASGTADEAGESDRATNEARETAQPTAPTGPAAAAADSRRVFYIGHSLMNWTVPYMVESLATAARVGHEFEVNIGIGAPMKWLWERPETGEGTNPHQALPARPFDVVVITEALRLEDHIQWSDSAGYLGRFVNLARRGNPDVQVYLYETWHSRNEPRWRERLGPDLRLWESIADASNRAHDGRDVLIIPAGQAMGRLHDEIAAGRVPGMRSIAEVFEDDVHLNDVGWYFVALVQYATIFRRSPEGLPARTVDRFGAPLGAPPASAVPVMQRIAWETVRSYPRSGAR